jgi:hypothetical protein
VAFRALTSFVRGACDALTLTSSYKKRVPTPSPYPLVSELVQAQGCPVVRLGRVHVRLADNKASFGPGYEPGSRTSGGFRIQFPLMASLGGRAGALSGGSEAPGVVKGDALYDAMLRTRRGLNTTEPRRQRAACAATAFYHRLCT